MKGNRSYTHLCACLFLYVCIYVYGSVYCS